MPNIERKCQIRKRQIKNKNKKAKSNNTDMFNVNIQSHLPRFYGKLWNVCSGQTETQLKNGNRNKSHNF